jgi:hypothetical protein
MFLVGLANKTVYAFLTSLDSLRHLPPLFPKHIELHSPSLNDPNNVICTARYTDLSVYVNYQSSLSLYDAGSEIRL